MAVAEPNNYDNRDQLTAVQRFSNLGGLGYSFTDIYDFADNGSQRRRFQASNNQMDS